MRYFIVDNHDVVLFVSDKEEEVQDTPYKIVDEDAIDDFRFVDFWGRVLASSDVYDEIKEVYKENEGQGTIRVLY